MKTIACLVAVLAVVAVAASEETKMENFTLSYFGATWHDIKPDGSLDGDNKTMPSLTKKSPGNLLIEAVVEGKKVQIGSVVEADNLAGLHFVPVQVPTDNLTLISEVSMTMSLSKDPKKEHRTVNIEGFAVHRFRPKFQVVHFRRNDQKQTIELVPGKPLTYPPYPWKKMLKDILGGRFVPNLFQA